MEKKKMRMLRVQTMKQPNMRKLIQIWTETIKLFLNKIPTKRWKQNLKVMRKRKKRRKRKKGGGRGQGR